jgi:ABC-type nitrate/sulfonate/bicarbonate transport system permease component
VTAEETAKADGMKRSAPGPLRGRGRLASLAARALPIPVLLSIWEAVARAGYLNEALFPAPSVAFRTFLDMLYSGELVRDTLATIARATAGFAFGSALGIILGTLTARIRLLDKSLGQVIGLLRPIPPIAIVPLFVVWLGLGEFSKLTICAWGVFFPVWVSTHVGVSRVPKELTRAAASLGARPRRLLFHVVLPAAASHVVAGMRVAVAIALICVVVAEMIGAYVGLGYRINTSYMVFRVDRMIVGLAMLGVIGAVADALFTRLVMIIMPWYSLND